MIDFLYGIFAHFDIMWIFLGFTGLILLVNLFAAVFCIKGERKNKAIKVRSERGSIILYSLFVFFLTFLCKKNIEITIGVVSLIAFCDVVFYFIFLMLASFFKNKTKKDFSFYKTINTKVLPSEKVISAIKVKPKEEHIEENPLNISHVKGIINKLNCFSLSVQERKQVNDLIISIKKYEEGQNNCEVISEINDGLNSLLKIMARYSV